MPRRDGQERQAEKEREQQARAIIGERMEIAASTVGLKQAGAGKRFGIKPGRWGQYARGERTPPAWLLRELPEKFGRQLTWFFGLPDPRGLDETETEIVDLLRHIRSPDLKRNIIELLLAQLREQVRVDERLRA